MKSDSLIGRQLGAFEVLAWIGSGGMADVYKGRQPALNRYVAIKILGQGLASDEELTQRFRREAQTIAQLRHPNIIQVHDFGTYEGGHYLVMEYVEGSDLRAEMDRRRAEPKPFTPEEILNLLAQVADALDYAHDQGVIHRDVKPGNILLRHDGQVILSDFGLAMLRDRVSQATSGHTFGTPEYIAPEQALDSRAASPRSDIYSLGGIAYEMITGRLPFEAESALSLALKHVSERPGPPRHYAPDLPVGVEAAIIKALAKEPKARFPSARALVEAMRDGWSEDDTTQVIGRPGAEIPPILATPAPPSQQPETDAIPGTKAPEPPDTPPPAEKTGTGDPAFERVNADPIDADRSEADPVAASTPPSRRWWLWGIGAVVVLLILAGALSVIGGRGPLAMLRPTEIGRAHV
jgi:eukaryotic-like serine/threonine-protein kinase